MDTSRVPTHPGEILLHEFLEPLGVDVCELAQHMGIAEDELKSVVSGRANMTSRLAWLLSMAFGTTPRFWMNLQSSYALASDRPEREIPPFTRSKA